MKIILASGNSHKLQEFQELLGGKADVSFAPDKLEVLEDGESFSENAYKKAKAYYDKFKIPTLADDSGLLVESLPGELGIHSARFGGDGHNDRSRAELLLTKMQEVSDRSAYFVCLLCFYLSPSEIYYFEGRLSGEIANEYKGDGGFGYDPVFIPEGLDGSQTLAQLGDWKQKHSHRAAASEYFFKFLDSNNCQNSGNLL